MGGAGGKAARARNLVGFNPVGPDGALSILAGPTEPHWGIKDESYF